MGNARGWRTSEQATKGPRDDTGGTLGGQVWPYFIRSLREKDMPPVHSLALSRAWSQMESWSRDEPGSA